MSYKWHSQRQGSFDAIRLTWIATGTTRRGVEKKKKNTKNEEEHKNTTIDSIFVTIREKRTTYTGVTLRTSFTLILL